MQLSTSVVMAYGSLRSSTHRLDLLSPKFNLDQIPGLLKCANMREGKGGTFLIIIPLVVVISLNALVPVGAAPSAIIVYDHGLAKEIRLTSNGHLVAVNKTSSFTQDDLHVYSYASAAFYSANITWSFYDPSGELFYQNNHVYECTFSPCYIYDLFNIAHTSVASKFGLWSVQLSNGNTLLFTDYFYISPILTQENKWSFSVEESTTPDVQGNLTVIIHPNNGTWTHYQLYMPYASNITAIDPVSGKSLTVTKFNDTRVVLDLGGSRSNGYSFVISFNLRYGVNTLNGWYAGVFAFNWEDDPWERFHDPHPIYETFNITLPKGADLLDAIGVNMIALRYEVAGGERVSVSFDDTIISQAFGWTILYRDFTYRNSHTNTPTSSSGFNVVSGPTIPILPLTVANLNVWSAVMAVFLLTASELASPLYARSGSRILIDRKRLRIAAIMLVGLFLMMTAYQLILTQNIVPR